MLLSSEVGFLLTECIHFELKSISLFLLVSLSAIVQLTDDSSILIQVSQFAREDELEVRGVTPEYGPLLSRGKMTTKTRHGDTLSQRPGNWGIRI